MFTRAALVALALAAAAPAAAEIIGTARVIDGDTIDIATAPYRTRIRLNAIDAPEAHQLCADETGASYACGKESTAALRQMIEGRTVTCEPHYADRYGRTVATCSGVAGDIGAAMVRSGHAVAFRKYGLQYVGAEDEARSARRGIWRGTFLEPAVWRAQHTHHTSAARGLR